jgi:uncharacterized membrane protein
MTHESVRQKHFALITSGLVVLLLYSVSLWGKVPRNIKPDFALSTSLASLSVTQGKQGNSTIATTVLGGFNRPITLSASGLPSGTTVSYSPNPIRAPGPGNSTVTVQVGSSTRIGTYRITVTGSSSGRVTGGVKHTVAMTLVVTPTVTAKPLPNFTLSTSSPALTIMQGNRGSSTITAAVVGGFKGSITLAASGAPPGTTVNSSPNPIRVPGAGKATITIRVGSNTPIGAYLVTLSGSSAGSTAGGINHTVALPLALVVTAKPQPNFAILTSPSSLTIAQGKQGSSTITTANSGGFSRPVMLSAAGVPTGATVSAVPNPIPAPGAGNSTPTINMGGSTMTINVGSSTPTGTYQVTVTGRASASAAGGVIQRTAIITLTVVGSPNFLISALPGSLNLPQGNHGAATITTTITGGFDDSIGLSASGMPNGVTVGFAPQTISAPGAGSSAMTVAVGGATPQGTYPITVSATGGGIQQTTTLTLTVTVPVPGGSLPSAYFMEPYSSALQSSFGASPYSYQLVSGSLPAGINVDASGNLTGTATAVGQFTFQMLVTDSSQPPQQQASDYTLTVTIRLDAYGGLAAVPVPECTPTGYFQTLKVNGRWVLVTPLCNAFRQLAVYDAAHNFIDPAVMAARYDNDGYKWSAHALQRMLAAGFNATDIYAYDGVLPVGKYGRHGAPSGITVPFSLNWSALNDWQWHWDLAGLSEPPKSECDGQDSYGFTKCAWYYAPDFYDPGWQQLNTWELSYDTAQFTEPLNTTPWMIWISFGDLSYANVYSGSANWSGHVYPHAGMITATANFNYTGLGGFAWTDPINHSKMAWACGGNNPASGDGSSYLEQKYHTIAALNAAWGSTYTAFCDAGGFGKGTGVLDEDGRHGWFGAQPLDYFNLAGVNANLKADLEALLRLQAGRLWGVQASTVRSYDSHHLLFCGASGGVGDGGVRTAVLLAAKDAGCQGIQMAWDNTDTARALSTNNAEYDAAGLPAVIWYGLSAQADSYYSAYPNNGAFHGDFPTQEIRGQHYASDQQLFFDAAGSNGDHYVLGINFWSLTDNGTEKTNYGLISNNDNSYNGNCAAIVPTTDPWGYPCGGESANYGDFLTSVTESNSNVLQELSKDLVR